MATKNEYFAIKMTKEGPMPETFASSRKAREAAFEHYRTSNKNTVVGRIGAKSFNILGKKAANISELAGVLNESNFQSVDLDIKLTTTYFVYCLNERRRVSPRFSSRNEAQRNADAHYNATGGSGGGHNAIVETIVR